MGGLGRVIVVDVSGNANSGGKPGSPIKVMKELVRVRLVCSGPKSRQFEIGMCSSSEAAVLDWQVLSQELAVLDCLAVFSSATKGRQV